MVTMICVIPGEMVTSCSVQLGGHGEDLHCVTCYSSSDVIN